MTNAFIAHDWCGWNENYGRYTHVPSGDTLVCKAYMNQMQWDQAQHDWLNKYPDLTVHSCPTGPYSQEGKSMGTTTEICARLQSRLSNK